MLETGVPLDPLPTDDEVFVKASIAGLTAEDIKISITGEMLTIQGEVKQDEEQEGAIIKFVNAAWKTSLARSHYQPWSMPKM